MIGIEAFTLANVFMCLAAASCIRRLFRDTIYSTPRRIAVLAIGVLILGSIVSADIQWTRKKKLASEERSKEIPGLQQTIRDLQATVDKQNLQLNAAQAQSDQKLNDIEGENKGLRHSVETKDAALVAIARQQYALNYAPEVATIYDATAEQMEIINKGKTNIEVWGGKVGNEPVLLRDKPVIVAPETYEGYYTMKDRLTVDAISTGIFDGSVTYDCAAFIRTLDDKRYIVSYRVRLVMEAGKTKRIDVFSNGVVPTENWPTP
jgi:hypothetical protein